MVQTLATMVQTPNMGDEFMRGRANVASLKRLEDASRAQDYEQFYKERAYGDQQEEMRRALEKEKALPSLLQAALEGGTQDTGALAALAGNDSALFKSLYAQQKEEELMRQQLAQRESIERAKLAANAPVKRAQAALYQQQAATQRFAAEMDFAKNIANGLSRLGEEQRPQAWRAYQQMMINAGGEIPEQFQGEYTPEKMGMLNAHIDQSMAINTDQLAENALIKRNLGVEPEPIELAALRTKEIQEARENLPKGYMLDDQGNAVPIEGTPAQVEAQDKERKQRDIKEFALSSTENAFREIAGLRDTLNQPGLLAASGGIGRAASLIPNTDAEKVANSINALSSAVGLDRLIEMKRQGATFGALSDAELKALRDSAAALSQADSKEEIMRQAKRLERFYMKMYRGAGGEGDPYKFFGIETETVDPDDLSDVLSESREKLGRAQ